MAETLWLLDRRDHLAVVESALRDRALPADFRFPMTDARLALARLCALDGRLREANRWFEAARAVLDAQGARPLRAVVDHDEALMHLRLGDTGAAAPHVARGEQVQRLTGGAVVEAVIDFVGEGDAPASSLGMVRARGTYCVVGYGGELRVPTFNLVLPEISVVGNAVGTHDDLRELIALTAAGGVRLRTRTYPLEAYADAIADLENGRMHGRGVLVP